MKSNWNKKIFAKSELLQIKKTNPSQINPVSMIKSNAQFAQFAVPTSSFDPVKSVSWPEMTS